jgi:hypothetical protein
MRSLRLAVLGGLACVLAPAAGQAATLDVCATACTYSSIQAAVDAAAPGDTIDIRAGTYSEDVDVSVAGLTFTGAGAGVSIVEGMGFAAFIFRDSASPVTLSGVTLRSPVAVSCLWNYGAALTVRDSVMENCAAFQVVGNVYVGGAIYTTGDLLMERVTVRNNTANSAQDGRGGGLYVDGSLVGRGPVVRILASEFSSNTAFHGGAIYIEAGARVFIDGTLITGNIASAVTSGNEFLGRGGGIFSAGELHLTRSTLSGNFAESTGGGLAVYAYDQDVRIATSSFTGNQTIFYTNRFPQFYSGGAIYVESGGDVTVTGSELAGNVSGLGGAIGMYNVLSDASVSVKGSSILSNLGASGGGLHAVGVKSLTLNQVTVAGNMASLSGSGGGLYAVLGTQAFIRNSTISGNTADGSGGGIDNADGSFTLRNTIVAGNTASTPPIAGGSSNDCHGNIDSDDFNLIGTTDGCTAFTQANDLTGTDAAPVDPLLLPLGDYGGLSQTLPLDTGSPAIDSGGVCPVLDQRGHQRPADGGSGVATCDRGAVEVQGSCGPPLPAEPLEPADAAVGIVLAPLLVWEPSYNALSYDVVLATQVPPAGILETVSGITATHWKPSVALSPGTTYYWQIRGHSPCGRRELSAVFSFTTQ